MAATLRWLSPGSETEANGKWAVIWVGSLDGEKARRLPLTSTNTQYSAGYLLFSKEADLVAQKFDLSHLTLSGPEFPVARDIEYDTFIHAGMFSVSTQGSLVYAGEGVGVNKQLTWLDRQGNTEAGRNFVAVDPKYTSQTVPNVVSYMRTIARPKQSSNALAVDTKTTQITTEQ